MNYQVLARKWRPQRFTEVVGQQHVLTALVNALAQGRLHHAYLFSGTRGVGKTSIARLLAKALNCDKGITPEPCGTCSSCVEIEQGRFVDLLEIDAASRTKVEDTRELLDNVQYQPARGRFKVYLIDEVHMLSRHSFNALLKTLEEPPPHVKFLLATTDPQKLPITILSRCLQFHLKSLSPEQIDGQLQHILRQEQLPFAVEATAALARAADGSVRDALSLTDQALAFGNGEIKLADVETMLGNLNHNQLIKLINALLAGDGGAMLAQVAELASMGPDYDHIHKELVGFWHQLAMAQLVPAPALLPYADELNRLAPLISAEQIQLYYQICLQGRKDLPFAADGRAALEMTLLRTLAFQPTGAQATQAAAAKPASIIADEPATLKKPEPPHIAPSVLTANTAVNADAPPLVPSDTLEVQRAAELYHEQETILAQAAEFGYQAAPVAAVPATAAPLVAASQLMTAELAPTGLKPTELISTERAPVGSDITGADAFDAEVQGSNVQGSNVQGSNVQAAEAAGAEPKPELASEPEPHSQSEPVLYSQPEAKAELENADPAAANVAQIRRLLQTRNRLRSQDLATPDNTPGVPGDHKRVEPSYVPPRARAPEAEPLSVTQADTPGQGQTQSQAQAQTQGHGTAPAHRHQDDAAKAQPTSNELPPLDAYADMGSQPDYDDLPPWAEESSGASTTPWPTSGTSPSASSQALPQTTSQPVTPSASSPVNRPPPKRAAVSTSEPASAMANHIGISSVLRPAPAQAPGDPEPLKPSSLLIKASDPWTMLVAQLSLGGLLRQLAMHSCLEQPAANQWQLWLKPEHKHLLNDAAALELAQLVSQHQQMTISLQVQVGELAGALTPADIEQQLYQGAMTQAKDEIEADDAVQFLLSRFAAELDRDSIEPMAQ